MSVYDVNGNNISNVYDSGGVKLLQAYDINGRPLMRSHAVSNRYTRSLIFSNSSLDSGTQGIACDSITQKIAQLYTGKIYMFAIDGTPTQVASVFNLGHGSAGQFAPTKIESQVYPLLYVSSGGSGTVVGDLNYAILLEVQCAENSSSMLRAFAVTEDEGYAGMFAIDFDNNIVYHVYREAYDSSTAELTYISAWEFSTMQKTTAITWNPRPANGVYILTNKLKSFTIPYVKKMQSVTFFDGLIVLLSDSGYVSFVDPVTESVFLKLTSDMPAAEREGVGFILNPSTQQYDMVISNRASGAMNFYRYEFDLS